MWADMFAYLDGVETNLAFLIKTTSRFRQTERTLVLKIQLLMNPTLSEKREKKLQNHRLIIAQSPAAPTLLYSDDFIATNVSMQTDLNAERNKARRFEFVLGWRLMMHSLSSFDNTVFSL